MPLPVASRLSNELLTNAIITYARFGLTFIMGIFLTWFLVGEIGLAGFGIISIAIGAFGLSAALASTVDFSLGRELAAAIATGEREKVERTFVSAMALTTLGSVLALLVSAVFAAVAYAGIFHLPEGDASLRAPLAALFLCEGLNESIRFLAAPYRRVLYCSRQFLLDNLLILLRRGMRVLAAVLVFGVFLDSAPLGTQLYAFGGAILVSGASEVLLAIILSRRSVPGLRLRPSSFDRDEFREIAGTVWHTGKFSLLVNFNPYFMAILINLYFGITYNGIWAIVMQVGGHAMLVSQGLLRGLDSITTHLHVKESMGMIRNLMGRAIRYQCAVATAWSAPYLIFMVPILTLWVGDRFGSEEALVQSGIPDAAEAIRITALLASLQLLAMIARVLSQGVERMLYGIGAVRSYAWFAKYSVLISMSLAVAMFTLTGSPIWAPISLLVSNVLFYNIVVLRAMASEAGLPALPTLMRSLPRPLLAAALLAAMLWYPRTLVDTLSLTGLVALAAATAVIYGVLFFLIVIDPDELGHARRIMREVLVSIGFRKGRK